MEELPPGVTGLLIAGVFAAAMSSLSSSINSLASSSAYDFWAPARRVEDDARILRAGKLFTLLWAGLLVGGAILFIPLSAGTSAVEVALAVASLVYGGLLAPLPWASSPGAPPARSSATGMVAGIGVVTAIWIFAPDKVAWPWFVLIGTVITVAVGVALGAAPASAPAERP